MPMRIVQTVLLLSLCIGIARSEQNQSTSATATKDSDESSIDFIWNPPGRMISVGKHRLHIHCVGDGPVTVLFEAGLGGSSLEWSVVQEKIANRTRACVYDRGGYGWSDPAAGRRDAQLLAVETNLLLNNLNIRGPLILIGHSFGGFVIRELANLRSDSIVGLILVDASHEKQVTEFEKIMPIANMPRGRSFVISPIDVPDGLEKKISFKIKTFIRMRKSYHAVHAEMESFRQSAFQASRLPRPVEYPIVVLRRGLEPFRNDSNGEEKTALWKRLQKDLANLSSTGSIHVAGSSGHHIHIDEPDRVIEQIQFLLEKYEGSIL